MQASEKNISQILPGNVTYIIPAYQRPYSWEVDNVIQLLDDIWDAYKQNSEQEYFIGSLITIELDKDRKYEVVDGQQRLTTLNIILSGLVEKIPFDQSEYESTERNELKRCILAPRSRAPSLFLREVDQPFFLRHILEAKTLEDEQYRKLKSPKKNLIDNFNETKKWLSKRSIDEAINLSIYIREKVYCVFVIADSQSSAYRLFNVLNARGMSLSNSDLIKNSIFNAASSAKEDGQKVEEMWLKLEDKLLIENMDSFFEYFRTMDNPEKASSSIHEEFQKIIDNNKSSIFNLLESLDKAAEIYAEIKDSNDNRAISSLKRVTYDEWIAPLIAYKLKKGKNETEFINLLEKITYQNWIRRLGRTARLTVYFQLIKLINSDKSFEEMQKVILEKANNNEFIQLLGSDFYGKPYAQAVLLRLDEAGLDNSSSTIHQGRLSIEHVMPQKLKDEYWSSRFSPEIHIEWLNKIGNLAMLSGSKNSAAQYFAFDKKKDVYGKRNEKVSFNLTKEILQVQEWNIGAIESRHNKLLELAKSLWDIN